MIARTIGIFFLLLIFWTVSNAQNSLQESTAMKSGEGTGLGLSLSYDIVNAHGGELKVETKEGEGS